MGKIGDLLLYISFGLLLSTIITGNVYVVIIAVTIAGVSGFCYGVGTWYKILLKEQNQDSRPIDDNKNKQK